MISLIFLANDETNQSFKMPLQELIDLMKDWGLFIRMKH